MDIDRLWYISFMLVGLGLFFGMTFPCLNGPFNVLKTLRDRVGKPFSCPVCSFLWPVVFASVLAYWVPMMIYMILGSVGWGMLAMHVSGYQIFYPGMEDE